MHNAHVHIVSKYSVHAQVFARAGKCADFSNALSRTCWYSHSELKLNKDRMSINIRLTIMAGSDFFVENPFDHLNLICLMSSFRLFKISEIVTNTSACIDSYNILIVFPNHT